VFNTITAIGHMHELEHIYDCVIIVGQSLELHERCTQYIVRKRVYLSAYIIAYTCAPDVQSSYLCRGSMTGRVVRSYLRSILLEKIYAAASV
jgi:hypothetical protein